MYQAYVIDAWTPVLLQLTVLSTQHLKHEHETRRWNTSFLPFVYFCGLGRFLFSVIFRFFSRRRVGFIFQNISYAWKIRFYSNIRIFSFFQWSSALPNPCVFSVVSNLIKWKVRNNALLKILIRIRDTSVARQKMDKCQYSSSVLHMCSLDTKPLRHDLWVV